VNAFKMLEPYAGKLARTVLKGLKLPSCGIKKGNKHKIMNRMTGIVLIIIGILTFVVGVIVYSKSNQTTNVADNGSELNQVIKMAIADGVLTSNERKVIKQISTEKDLNFNEIINDVEKQLSELKTDSETELIDYKKKNGYDFEKFVVQKFDKKYFYIKEWSGDKYVNGYYADTTCQPDLQLKFSCKNKTAEFSVECKWRSQLSNNEVKFATKEQLERYKNFEKESNNPVFIAIGIGGKAILPEQLYIVPLQKVDNNFIQIKELKKYEKEVNDDFFFDAYRKELR